MIYDCEIANDVDFDDNMPYLDLADEIAVEIEDDTDVGVPIVTVNLYSVNCSNHALKNSTNLTKSNLPAVYKKTLLWAVKIRKSNNLFQVLSKLSEKINLGKFYFTADS